MTGSDWLVSVDSDVLLLLVELQLLLMLLFLLFMMICLVFWYPVKRSFITLMDGA